MTDTRARAAAEDVKLYKVNSLLGHWMGGINPCICMRCKDVAAYVADAVAQTVKDRDKEIARLKSIITYPTPLERQQAEEIERLRAEVHEWYIRSVKVREAVRAERERCIGILQLLGTKSQTRDRR